MATSRVDQTKLGETAKILTALGVEIPKQNSELPPRLKCGGKSPADPPIAADFLTVETVRLQRLCVLCFIELGSPRVHFAGCSANPNSPG